MSLRGAKGLIIVDDYFDNPPKHIHTFSMESKILRETYHYADLIKYSDAEFHEIISWCNKTLGWPGYCVDTAATIWDYTSNPHRFWFSDQKNLTLFVLRWS